MENTVKGIKYAGFWKRAAAWVIDIFVVVLPLGAIFLIFAMIYSGGDGPMEYIDNQLALMRWKAILFRAGMLACMLYWSLMESSARQATLGKRVMKIKVVDLEGRRISFGKAAVRALIKGLLSNIFAIGYFITLFTKKSQALHDLIAGCLVVKQSPSGQSDATSPPKQEQPAIPSPSDRGCEKPIEQPSSSSANQFAGVTLFSRFVEKCRNAIKGKHKNAVVYSLITIITLAVVLIVVLIFAGISVSKDYALYEQVPQGEGRAYWLAKNYPQKGTMWRLAAIFGNSKAAFFIGKYYGSNIPEDGSARHSVKWYKWSAWLGNSNAQANLGVMYINGNVVDQDYKAAYRWIRRCALNSDDFGLHMMGMIYQEGWGVQKDFTEAAFWFRKAAFQGYSDAQLKLGYLYDEGLGVDKDDGQAAGYYWEAAQQGNSQAQYNLGLMYEYGEGVSKSPAAAIAMYRKAANQGHADAWQRLRALEE